jgi:hypothetical protein
MAQSRRGGFPLFRVGVLVGIFGAILVIGGIVAFFSDQASRQAPLEVEPFPGAEFWGYGDQSVGGQTVFYRVSGALPEDVAIYYEERLDAHAGDPNENCVRVPDSGEFDVYDASRGEVPFLYKCLFDRSGFNQTQYTEVIVMPGLPNENPEYNTEGMTVVQYNQRWMP